MSPATDRRATDQRVRRLHEARLYFVCEGLPGGREPSKMLRCAIEEGVDVIQLREKSARSTEELLAMAEPFRAAADEGGALFILNDRPDLVEATGADGVHVGQDDESVERARELCPPGSIVGLSTHSFEQLRAARSAVGGARPDQISVGPVWETPTKEGRPAVGLELIERAALDPGPVPWFAIGGIDLERIGDIVDAGAGRAVVVRAIRDAEMPRKAAAELRRALERIPLPETIPGEGA